MQKNTFKITCCCLGFSNVDYMKPYIVDGKSYNLVEISFCEVGNTKYKGMRCNNLVLSVDKLQKMLDYSKCELKVGEYYDFYFKKWNENDKYKLNAISPIAKLAPVLNVNL